MGEQEHWRQRFVAVLKRQIEQYSQQKQYHEALGYTSQLLKITPWDEEAHQQTMLFLAKTGQYKAAFKQFETCRLILDEEFAVEPSSETIILHHRIQAAEASAGHTLPHPDFCFDWTRSRPDKDYSLPGKPRLPSVDPSWAWRDWQNASGDCCCRKYASVLSGKVLILFPYCPSVRWKASFPPLLKPFSLIFSKAAATGTTVGLSGQQGTLVGNR